jgi:outer membrane protein TolC
MKTPYLMLALVLVIGRTEAARGEALTLAAAIERAQAASPDIRQLEEQYSSASAKKRQALSPAEPSLTLGFNDLTDFTLGTATSNVYTLTQTLGFPGRALLNRSALSEQSEAVNSQLKSMRLQVSSNVKQAYYGLALARKNIQLNNDQRLSYERILAIAKRRYETGNSAQVDYLNAQVQLLQNENDLTDLQSAERAALTQLDVLLGVPAQTPFEVVEVQPVDRPAVDLDTAEKKMLANRNEIQAAQHQLEASGKSYALAWMSLLPDFQLSAGTTFYNVQSASPLSNTPAAGAGAAYPTHTYLAGLQIQIPLWFLFNEREAIVGASHDRAAAEANLSVVYEQSRNALVTAVESINSNRVKIDNYQRHMLPMAEQSLNLALISYGAGKVDFQTLADTAAARRQIRLAYANAIVSFLNSYATYGTLIGEDL